MLLDRKMDIENVEMSLTEDQKKTIQNLYSVFPRDITENFVNSLVLRNSLPGIFEPPKSKSPMKQVTLDKWFVKSPKVTKTNEMSNSKSSTSTTPDGSSNNKILVMESSNKTLTDEEIIKQIGKKELMISLQRYNFEDNTKERSTVQKGQVIENSGGSPVIAEKTGAESFDLVEKNVTDQSTHFSMSHSAPTKVLIPKMCRVESTEFNFTQSNAVEEQSIVKGKVDDILENKTSKQNSSLVNKKVAKVLRKRSKSCLNSDGSPIAQKPTTVNKNLDLIKENTTIASKVLRKTSKSYVIYDSDSSSIAEKVPTVHEDFDLLNKSTNDKNSALNIPQSVSAKQPTCKARQRSRTLSMENTHSTSHFNLTKQNNGLNNNEANVLECEAPMQISSFINENVSKYPKSDKQNSVTLSPLHPTSKVTFLLPNPISLPGKTEKANKKPKTTVRTHKQSGTTPKMFETTEERNKPEITEDIKSETSKTGNQMSEQGNKKSKTTGEEDLKVSRKRNKKSKKNKKSDRKSETTDELNVEVLEATEKLKELLEITERSNDKFEMIEEGYHMSEEGNHMSGEPNIKLEKEEKSEVIGKVNKKSKKIKKSIQELETNEKPDELMETIDKVVQNSEMIEKNKSVTKKASRKGKMARRNSKLVTEHSQVMDAAMEVGEISVESRAEVQNEKSPMSVDLPLTKKIGTVGSSEADKLTSEDPQCNASVGLSQAESDEKQKNYDAFCTLQGVCSSLGINVEHLFQNKKLTRRLKSSCKRDSCAFMQGHKLKNGQTAPSVYMHDSKEQCEDILKTYK